MLIIGITGGTGSGKTTMVTKILNELPKRDVSIITQDSYYKDTTHLTHEERVKINFDHPNAIDFELLTKHLTALKNNESIHQPIYSFVKHNRSNDTLLTLPKKVMIVEGILILTKPELRDLFDIKIFIHADADERLIRRLKRDTTERNRNINEVLTRYQTTLKPMHDQFIEPTKAYADIIIPNNKHNKGAINMVKTIINNKL